jgi:formamidopyrimidine-DNA glycosylase
MPELPEVETIRLGLQKKIIGLKIKEVEVIAPKSFLGNSNLLRGKIVLNITRRAKILGIELSGNLTILFHLKMTGQIIFDGGTRFVGGHPTEDMVGPLPNSHTRIIFTFSDHSKLYFNDMRRFGWVKIVTSTEVTSNKLFALLGPEPLEPGFTWQILKKNLLRHPNMPIKVALLDQKVVSGIGNIYASEACFNAGIDPRIRVNQLSDNQLKRLHKGIIKALKDGIKYGGSTRANFVDSEGKKGYFLDYAFVYGKDKKPCKKCKSEIKKIQLGGRGTYFCPTCQKI